MFFKEPRRRQRTPECFYNTRIKKRVPITEELKLPQPRKGYFPHERACDLVLCLAVACSPVEGSGPLCQSPAVGYSAAAGHLLTPPPLFSRMLDSGVTQPQWVFELSVALLPELDFTSFKMTQ